MNQKLKSLLLLLLVTVSANAQIEDGKIYNFVNVDVNTSSMVIASNSKVAITGTNTADYNQLWYVLQNDDNSYSLRNLGNGRYLRSSNAVSAMWTTVKELDDNCKFYCEQAGSGYTLRATNSSWYGSYCMHYGKNEGLIVCWSADNPATQWMINPITTISNEALNENWNELISIDPASRDIALYQSSLDNLFSDKACTTLKKSFANENAVKNDADYNALPATLQEMVLKVYKNSWTEANYDNNKPSWDGDYAKKYRVQLYEPYNEPEAAANALGINAHTNLNNPTGIFANDREAIYVMVDGEIETGASLYITSYKGNGNLDVYDDGVELKQGLNIVPSFGNGNNFCINYVVHTFDTSKGKGNKAKAYRLSAFDDLKIHIEGGYINGYYNKMGDDLYAPDQGANWDYLEAHAPQTTVTILGEYITLQFPLNDAVDDSGNTNKGMSYYLDQNNVEGIIDEWDNVMLWERLVLGLLDEETTNAEAKKSPYSTEERVFDYTGNDGEFAAGYEDYYNVHGLSLGVGYNYMYGGWDHCGYHYNTMESILTNLPYNAGSHWGPGHEIGHQHQKLLTVNGLTEVTNNLFSNVVLWYYGETTSRVNGDEGSLSHVLAAFNTEGSDFFTNNIWALTHMYYKLFLYYHVLGHNTKFYPTLFEMLRQDPMSGGYNQNGATSLLHFYKKCCLASGDDLTEFFRAHGFFSVMDNRLVGDYSNSVYTTTQADIDAAIMEIKDWAEANPNVKENIAVLFINDATGETIKSHKGDNLTLYGETTVCAEVGGYASFADNTTSDYTYSVSGTTVTMEGEGGTGFAIFNEKGEIIAFSDKRRFQVSETCATTIALGKASVAVVKGDNTIVPAVDVMETDDSEAKYIALGNQLEIVAELLSHSDDDNTKPGFYRASALVALQNAYANALTVYEDKAVNSYKAMYNVLSQEYTNALTAETSPFLPGSTYVLTNKKYSNVSMTLYNGKLMGRVTDMSLTSQQWTFESTGEKDVYYLKNVDGSYLGSLLKSTQVGVTTRDLASRYKLFDLGKGLWALQCQNDEKDLMSLHCNSSYQIVGWTHTAINNEDSWWYLTATAKDESMLPLYDLQNLISKTEALLDEMTTDNKYQNFITADLVEDVNGQLYEARQKCASMSVSEADVEAMQGQYDRLHEAYQNANDIEFNAKKEELLTLISSTHSLINSCGTVTYIPGNYQEVLELQTTEPYAYNYLSTNANETKEEEAELLSINNLIDNDNATYFHSAWSWDVNEVHHLKVDLGEGQSIKKFIFNYTTGKRPFPYEIKVYGSNNDASYTHLRTFSKSDSENRLPTTEEAIDDYRELWTSPAISSGVAYRYLRFDVTNSGGKWSNAIPEGEYCFSMSSFGIVSINETDNYTVELLPDAGDVNEALLLATYKMAQEALAVANGATTEAQLQEAFADLQVQHSELYFAKDNTIMDVLGEWIAKVDQLIALCGTVTPDGEGGYTATLIPATSGDVTEALLIEAYMASEQAKVLLEDGLKDELEQAKETLMLQYETLDAERQSTVKSTLRAQLRELVAQIGVLIAECGTIEYGETEYCSPISLQTSQSDAAFYLSTNAQESSEGPIANLLKEDDFFHSSWSEEIGAAHYLQVDMGNAHALDKFAFSYTTRDNGEYGPHPSVIVVSGSNTGEDNSFVELATFDSGLPNEGNSTWNATNEHVITASQAYRYLRFTVTQSLGLNGSNHKESNEYYFAMSKFALFDVTYNINYYVESLNPYGSVTEEQLLEAFNVRNEAEVLADNSNDKDALEAKIAELRGLYAAIEVAHNDNSYLPVTLTTDMESPVLYMLYSQRGDNKVLQYNPASGHKLDIVDASDVVDVKQLFFFTIGEERGQVYVHPFVAGEKVLSSTDISRGADKVQVSDKLAAESMQWTFVEESIDNTAWYSLKAADYSFYFSNFGGGDSKMGFYDTKDEGSRFTFTSVSIEGSIAFHSLRTYYDEAIKDVSSNNPYYYCTSQAYEEAYAAATELLRGNADYATYLSAYYALYAANEALEMILPEEGKSYVIRSAHDGYAKNALLYANPTDNKMYWGTKETSDVTAIWTFAPTNDGAFHICNCGTGKSINEFTAPMNDVAGNILIAPLTNDGQVSFSDNDNLMHAQSGGAIVIYPGGANTASAWRIEEVSHETSVENVMVDADAVIYDLYGRRIVKVVDSGLYIIDGEKRYVQIK